MSWNTVFVLCLLMGLILTETPGVNAGLIRRGHREKRRANNNPCKRNPLLPQCKSFMFVKLLLDFFSLFNRLVDFMCKAEKEGQKRQNSNSSQVHKNPHYVHNDLN